MAADEVLARKVTGRGVTFSMTLPLGITVEIGEAVVLFVTQRQGCDPSLRFPGRCLSVDSETRVAEFAIDAVPEGLYAWLLSGTVVNVSIGSS